MPTTPVLLVLLASLFGCQSASIQENVDVGDDDHVSFSVPEGFQLTREKGTWVLVAKDKRAQATISIRAVPRDGWSDDRSPGMLQAHMESAMRAYPGSSLRGPTELDDTPYPGFAFDITYQPRSKKGQRYRRRHATLVGPTRVIHVFETWPATEQETARKAFQSVLYSVREEG
jgi:hypothetical protein